MRMLRSAILVLMTCLTASPVAAAPILIDFESLSEGQVDFTDSGAAFTGATILTAGTFSYNDIDFPPFSGVNLVGAADPLRIAFDQGVSSVGGYFTYSTRLTMSAFSATGTLLSAATSRFDFNYRTNADQNPDNEFMGVSALTEAIAYVTIAGFQGGELFAFDDLSFETIEGGGGIDPNPVPEPATVTLMLLGAAVAAGRQKLRARRRAHA